MNKFLKIFFSFVCFHFLTLNISVVAVRCSKRCLTAEFSLFVVSAKKRERKMFLKIYNKFFGLFILSFVDSAFITHKRNESQRCCGTESEATRSNNFLYPIQGTHRNLFGFEFLLSLFVFIQTFFMCYAEDDIATMIVGDHRIDSRRWSMLKLRTFSSQTRCFSVTRLDCFAFLLCRSSTVKTFD